MFCKASVIAIPNLLFRIKSQLLLAWSVTVELKYNSWKKDRLDYDKSSPLKQYFFFSDTVLLCSPGFSWILEPSASAFWVLVSEVWMNIHGTIQMFPKTYRAVRRNEGGFGGLREAQPSGVATLERDPFWCLLFIFKL